jgi:putative hydrolase of HD superfamily
MNVQQLLGFCELMVQFQEVDRRLLLPSGAEENDAEHSYILAMTAWYVVSTAKLELDLNLVIKYALAHDIIETYAGDTFIYDEKLARDKSEREHAAAEILQRNYPEFDELHHLVERYEKRNDPESRFVYALDKIVPVLLIYLGEGRSWQRDGITLEMLRTNKDKKIAVSELPLMTELWTELTAILAKQPELFPSPKRH